MDVHFKIRSFFNLALFLVFTSCGKSSYTLGPSAVSCIETVTGSITITTPVSTDTKDVAGETWTGTCVGNLPVSVTGVSAGLNVVSATCTGGVFSAPVTYSGRHGARSATFTQTNACGSVALTRRMNYYPPTFTIYSGIQGNDGHSYVQVFTYDTTNNTYGSPTQYQADNGVSLFTDSIRALALKPDGNILVGSTSSDRIRLFNTTLTTFPSFITLGGVQPESHGHCVLPNGRIISSAYDGGTAQTVREYTSTGAYLRDVITLDWIVGSCTAVSNTEVFIVDYNGNTNSEGVIRRLTFNGAAWTEIDSFDSNSVSPNISWYTGVVHSNGYVYLPPQALYAGAPNADTRFLFKCSQSDLANTCATEGPDMNIAVGLALGDTDEVQGGIEIPGHDDVLFMANDSATGSIFLFRYDTAAHTYSMATPSGVAFDTNVGQIRHMLVR